LRKTILRGGGSSPADRECFQKDEDDTKKSKGGNGKRKAKASPTSMIIPESAAHQDSGEGYHLTYETAKGVSKMLGVEENYEEFFPQTKPEYRKKRRAQ